MVRAAVLVSGGGTNLQAILDAKANGEIPSCEIALVLASNETAFALQRANNSGVKTAVLCKKDFADGQAYDKALIAFLQENDIDMVVLAGFLTILGVDFIRAYEDKIINVHPSLIPSFCGAGFYGLKVHEAALAKGVKITGATVHFVNEIPDGGKIILQKAVEVLPQDSAETLQKRVMQQAEWELLPKAVELVAKSLNS